MRSREHAARFQLDPDLLLAHAAAVLPVLFALRQSQCGNRDQLSLFPPLRGRSRRRQRASELKQRVRVSAANSDLAGWHEQPGDHPGSGSLTRPLALPQISTVTSRRSTPQSSLTPETVQASPGEELGEVTGEEELDRNCPAMKAGEDGEEFPKKF